LNDLEVLKMDKNNIKQEKNKQIILKETSCAICGNILDFTHFIDYGKNFVKETAVCNDCGVRFETKDFPLN